MRCKIVSAVVLAVVLASPLITPAHAGWKIEEVDPEFPQEVTTYWFQDGRVRVDGVLAGLAVLIDLHNEEGWLLEQTGRRCAGGKLTDLAEQLRKHDIEGTEEEPDASAAAAPAARPAPPPPQNIAIKDLGPGEPLLGHATEHYQATLEGEVLEEIWMASSVDVERDADLSAVASAMQKMLGDSGASQGYEDHPAYRKLRATGYPLKQVLFVAGEKSILEVKAAEAGNFPAGRFEMPKGCAKAGYLELLVGEEGK